MIDKLKCGAERKFLVWKLEDLEKLTEAQRELIGVYGEIIKENREKDGKNPTPEYIVINLDEPYVEKVIKIMIENKHWG